MNTPEWLPMKITNIIKSNDINIMSDYYYDYFKKDLIFSNVIFENKKVIVNSPIFNCNKKFVKSGKNCNNVMFFCENCIFKGKKELFCHVISKRDTEILTKLKSEYRNYQKSRVPGLFVFNRLEKVRWIKPIIEEYKTSQPADILYFDDTITRAPKERIIYFWLKEQNFVVILGENLWDIKQKGFLYLKTAFVIDEDETKYMLNRLYKKYKKRQEESSGVS